MTEKYFVAEVITYNDGTKDSPSIYAFNSEEEAMARYHKDMGAWMNKENVETVAISVFSNGEHFVKYDCHIREVKAEVTE